MCIVQIALARFSALYKWLFNFVSSEKGKKKVDFILAFGVSHQNKLSKKILYILFKSKNKFDLYVIDLNCLCLFWRRLMLLKEKIIY